MNATSKFADIHTYLATIGIRPKLVIEFMASPAFNLIARYAEGTILDPNTGYFNVRNALAFVQDQKCLPIMKDAMFVSALLCDIKNKSFLDLLSTEDIFTIARSVDSNIDRVWPDKDEARRVINSSIKDNTLRPKAVAAIYELLRTKPEVENKLLEAVKGGIANSTLRNRIETIDEDSLLEEQFSEEDYIDESALEDDMSYNQDEFFETWQLKKEDWIEVYRYVKNYLIPKNKALRKLKGDYVAQYNQLALILDAVEEQQILGVLCGINQGLDTNDFDEYKRVRRIEKFINRRYSAYVNANSGKKLDKFDFIKFLNDPVERQHQIAQYELVASTYNVLDIITGIPHYNAMSQLIAINRYLVQRSVALKMERDLAQAIITADKEIIGGFNYGDSQGFNQKEWAVLRNYVNDLLILKWFENQPSLNIGLPLGKRFYNKGKEQTNKYIDEAGKEYAVINTLNLNSLDGLASFKRLMDSSIIPELKKAFPDNAFLKDLTIRSTHNKALDRLQTFYCPSFDLTESNKNGSLKGKYDMISKAFNDLAQQELPLELAKQYNTEETTWKIGDLFFIYNLLVHKDSFSSRSFTKLFEDSNVVRSFIGRNYYQYLSDLDSRKIDYRELFRNELFPNFDARTKEQVNDYLIDLRVRLADFNSSYYNKFKVTSDGIGQSYIINILNQDNEPRDLKFWNPDLNPSDFTLWFPYKLYKYNPRVKPKVDERLVIKSGILENTTFDGVSSLAVKAICDRLQDLTNNKILIEFISTQELNDIWNSGNGEIKFVDEDDFLRTRDANAFIYNGKIYINDKKASIDKPIHEFLHIITAAMKYSGDRTIKQVYYKLLNDIVNDPDNADHYKNLQELYRGRRDSDIKEELLVEVLANKFAAQFEKDWEGYRSQTDISITETDLVNHTIEVLNSLFGSTIPEDIDAITLGNTDLRTLFGLFGTTLLGTDKNALATTIIPMDTKIRAIKDALINRDGKNNITFNGDCI